MEQHVDDGWLRFGITDTRRRISMEREFAAVALRHVLDRLLDTPRSQVDFNAASIYLFALRERQNCCPNENRKCRKHPQPPSDSPWFLLG